MRSQRCSSLVMACGDARRARPADGVTRTPRPLRAPAAGAPRRAAAPCASGTGRAAAPAAVGPPPRRPCRTARPRPGTPARSPQRRSAAPSARTRTCGSRRCAARPRGGGASVSVSVRKALIAAVASASWMPRQDAPPQGAASQGPPCRPWRDACRASAARHCAGVRCERGAARRGQRWSEDALPTRGAADARMPGTGRPPEIPQLDAEARRGQTPPRPRTPSLVSSENEREIGSA